MDCKTVVILAWVLQGNGACPTKSSRQLIQYTSTFIGGTLVSRPRTVTIFANEIRLIRRFQVLRKNGTKKNKYKIIEHCRFHYKWVQKINRKVRQIENVAFRNGVLQATISRYTTKFHWRGTCLWRNDYGLCVYQKIVRLRRYMRWCANLIDDLWRKTKHDDSFSLNNYWQKIMGRVV